MTTLAVRDNRTGNIVMTKTDDMIAIMTVERERARRNFTDATIEIYYGKIDGKPASKTRTFH